eukprot:scaffold5355_cov97-Skeletonema_marinoi.AAC.1
MANIMGLLWHEGEKNPHPEDYDAFDSGSEGDIMFEVDRLVEIDVLEKITSAESGGWGSPSFIIAKSNGQVRFLSDLREVNKRIVRKPFPLPKISDTLQRMEKFQWASAIDLNIV